MGRPTTKADLLSAATDSYEELTILIASLTEDDLSAPFDFSHDEKKKEAHWARDKNLRDVYIHLHEWHQLVLQWVASNKQGDEAPFIPLPYNWKTYGEMNVAFWEKHQDTPLCTAKALFEQSHNETVTLAATFSNEELFSKSVYPWVGGSTLGSYFASATSSHYHWACKKLKAHLASRKSAR